MKEIFKKLTTYFAFYGLYKKYRQITDDIGSNHAVCNIGDVMLKRDVPYENQILVASRMLDIERYYTGENNSFPYQNAIASARTGDESVVTGESFRQLLDSVKQEGFRENALFICDSEIRLSDGTHRLGVCLYLRKLKMNIKVLHRKIPYRYSGDNYLNMGMNSTDLRDIYDCFDRIQNKLIEEGCTFCCFISVPEVNSCKFKLIEDLKMMCTVLKTNHIAGGGIIAQFSMMQPKYIVTNGQLVSKRAQEIEQILKIRASGEATINVSKNCTEGKQMFDQYLRRQ